MKKVISPITGKSKYLLIENCEVISNIKISNELKESLKLSAGKNGTLIVKNLPGTILNRENQNGRIYSTEVLAQAIREAKPLFETKQCLSQADEHPEGSFVAPTHASHVVTNAYIKKNVNLIVDGEQGTYDMLFMDIEVLNTDEGKNLRALLEAECSVGTSIRGVGDMEGKYVKNYEILGIDFVGNPSSSTFTRMPVSESVQLEVKDPRDLKETFTVTTSSTNVVRDLEQAAQIQQQLEGIGYGTVTKTSTKLDQETDPKTGAQTSITTLEAETSDDVSDLDQALQMARNAMLNGTVNVDSITIENVQEEDETKESVEEVTYEPEDDEVIQESELTEAKKEDKEDDPNLGKKFVLKAGNRGFVTKNNDDNGIDFTQNPEEALHFVQGHEENGMIPISNIKKILDGMGIYDVKKYFQKTSTNLGAKKDQPKEEGVLGGMAGAAAGAALGTAVGGPVGTAVGGTVGYKIGDAVSDGNFPPAKEEAVIQEENGSNTKYTASVTITDANGTQHENINVSSVDLDSATKEIANLWDMKQKGLNGEGSVDIMLIDTVSGQQLHFNPESNLLESSLNEDNNDAIQVEDDKVITKLDDDNSVEKEFDSPLQAQVAASAVAQGKAEPQVLVPMDDATIEPEMITCAWCKDQHDKIDCKKEKDLGWLCPQCERSLASQGVELEFEDSLVDSMNEKLYSNPSEPSDELQKEPLTDATLDLLVRLKYIDWDIDAIYNSSKNFKDFYKTVQRLPDPVTIKVDSVELADVKTVGELKALILKSANKQIPWPIKNATLDSVNEVTTRAPII